jgi:phage antirepressor YoqD-like protein
MNLTNELKMTIKELAELLQVSHDAVTWHVKRTFPELMRNGKITYLNEEQVTIIKNKMLPTSGLVASVNTDLEMQQKAVEVFQWMQFKLNEQKKQIEEMKPKAEFFDSLTDSDSCFSLSDAVKSLHLTLGRNKFYELMRTDKIIMKGKTEPYQEFIDSGYLKLVIKNTHDDHFESVTLVTGKGLAWLAKKYDYLRIKEVI